MATFLKDPQYLLKVENMKVHLYDVDDNSLFIVDTLQEAFDIIDETEANK